MLGKIIKNYYKLDRMEEKRKLHNVFMERFRGRIMTIDKTGLIGVASHTNGPVNKLPKTEGGLTKNVDDMTSANNNNHFCVERSSAYSMPSMLQSISQ